MYQAVWSNLYESKEQWGKENLSPILNWVQRCFSSFLYPFHPIPCTSEYGVATDLVFMLSFGGMTSSFSGCLQAVIVSQSGKCQVCTLVGKISCLPYVKPNLCSWSLSRQIFALVPEGTEIWPEEARPALIYHKLAEKSCEFFSRMKSVEIAWSAG